MAIEFRTVRQVRNLRGRQKGQGVKRWKIDAASGSDPAPSDPELEPEVEPDTDGMFSVVSAPSGASSCSSNSSSFSSSSEEDDNGESSSGESNSD